MDCENILDSLLKLIPLDPEIVKFVRELFLVIQSICRRLFSSTVLKQKPTRRDIEDTAAKLREIITFFNAYDVERDEFIEIYPEWEPKRKENIRKLREIAESIRDSRQFCSVAQIVGGSVGVIGGVAIIGSILFPPAAPALLPAWLGGAAATALIPSFLLPTAATAVTSSLAVGGTIAASAGGVAQVATSITEAALLSSQIDKAKDICRQDKEMFDKMMKWFKDTQSFKSALDDLFDIDILMIIFKDLKDYFGQCDLSSMAFRNALGTCVRKTLGHGLFNLNLHLAVTAITFAVFLVRRRNRFLFQLIIGGFGLVAAFNATPQIGRLVASTVMKDAHLIPKTLASKVAVGALSGVGMVLDITNIVLNSIDLAEGSKSEVQEKVLEVAEELQKNLDFIRDVNQKLLIAAKKASEEYLNSLIIEKLQMNGTVTIIAHEIYQDVLQKTRNLRRSVQHSERADKQDENTRCLRIVIDFFNEADQESELFRNYFRQWESKRKENISNLHLIEESLREIRTLSGAAGVTDGTAENHAWLLQPLQRFTNKAILMYQTAINNSNTMLIEQLRKRTKDGNRICRQDRDYFIKMEVWFLRMHKLNFAFDELFGKGMFDTIFMDLKVFCSGGLQRYRGSTPHKTALVRCVRNIFSHPLRIDPSFQKAAIAVIFAVLLVGRRSLSHLNCFNVTRRLMLRRSIFRECRWTSDFTKYLDKEESVLQTLEINTVEGRHAFLDTINTVLNLANRHEAEIRTLAEELQEELDSVKEVWRQPI